MEESDLKARALAWSRYWRSGIRHSCPGSFAEHYGEATQAFWRGCFADVTDGDQTLELGCGNGSLIRWFAQAAARWPARYEAVDLAELDRHWLSQLPPELRERVRLHPQTSAMRLPLDAAIVNQVFSQYALEYFATDDCWSEISRVLASRATLAAIVHHRGSHPCRLAQAEASDSDWLLADGGPLDRAMAMLPWLAMSADPRDRIRRGADPRATEARQQFNTAFAQVSERMAASPVPDLLGDAAERTMRILEAVAIGGETEARAALQQLRAEIADNRLRVAELVDCALDRAGIDAWARRLSGMGFTSVAIGEIVEQGYLFGWSLVARRGWKE